MAQGMTANCPRCGATLIANQPFCAQCGLKLELLPSHNQLEQYSYPGQSAPQPAQEQLQVLPGTPVSQPAPDSHRQLSFPGLSLPSHNRPSLPGVPGQLQTPWPAAPPPSVTPLPPLAEPLPAPLPPVRKKPSRGKAGIVLVLILALLGSGGYLGYRLLNPPAPVQPPITTSALNTSLTYAGITITVQNVQQSSSFLDDPNPATTGILRVSMQAQNKTANPMNLAYATIARLVLPEGKTLAPSYIKSNIGIAAGATLNSALDFAVPTTVKPDQLLLRIGAENEVQMDIPLKQQADLGKYAPKNTKLDGTFSYAGLDWALVSATSQLSIDGQQASSGMRYLMITLKVNNSLSQITVIGSAFDYMHLKVASATIVPAQTTLPVAFEAGANGKTGTVTFLVPQDAAKLTLVLHSPNQSGFDPVTIDFQAS